MSDDFAFSIVVLVVALVLIAGTFSSRLTAWMRIPAPALFLIVAAVVALFLPAVGPATRNIDERIVSVALVLILFDGGMHIGWRRFRAAARPIAWIGIVGVLRGGHIRECPPRAEVLHAAHRLGILPSVRVGC